MTAAPVTVLIMAGGTGGHVFPALAVAEELRERGARVLWLGTRRGLEAQLVPAADFALHFVGVQGVRGKGLWGLLKAPFLVSAAIWQSLGVMRREKVSLAMGFGGFVAGPGGLAARLSGRALMIHEQNAVAGTTNRLLARCTARVFTAFPDVLKGAQVVGNPVRRAIVQLPGPAARYETRRAQGDALHLLVLGGSLGAAAINRLLPAALAALNGPRPEVWHQAGRAHAEATRADYDSAGVQARVEPFIDDMAAAYAWADLVICRAGALTVSELSAAGVASLLLPLPGAIDNHQWHNAGVLADAGAAYRFEEKNLSAQQLAELLGGELSRRETLRPMAEAARARAHPESAQTLARRALEVSNG